MAQRKPGNAATQRIFALCEDRTNRKMAIAYLSNRLTPRERDDVAAMLESDPEVLQRAARARAGRRRAAPGPDGGNGGAAPAPDRC